MRGAEAGVVTRGRSQGRSSLVGGSEQVTSHFSFLYFSFSIFQCHVSRVTSQFVICHFWVSHLSFLGFSFVYFGFSFVYLGFFICLFWVFHLSILGFSFLISGFFISQRFIFHFSMFHFSSFHFSISPYLIISFLMSQHINVSNSATGRGRRLADVAQY